MSRVLVTGRYDRGSYELVFAEGDRMGEVFQLIAPNDIIRIGNSIGGYWAKSILYAGQSMLALIRVSGAEREKSIDALRRAHGQDRGFVLLPMTGLWATSSGSAQRGIFHRYTEEEGDPIKRALREVRMPTHLLVVVPMIDREVLRGGSLCPHSTREGNASHFFETDGQSVRIEDGMTVETHTNQYHIGCQITPDRFRVSDGTWLIEAVCSKAMNGGNFPSISRVIIAVQADRDVVAERIRAMMR